MHVAEGVGSLEARGLEVILGGMRGTIGTLRADPRGLRPKSHPRYSSSLNVVACLFIQQGPIHDGQMHELLSPQRMPKQPCEDRRDHSGNDEASDYRRMRFSMERLRAGAHDGYRR